MSIQSDPGRVMSAPTTPLQTRNCYVIALCSAPTKGSLQVAGCRVKIGMWI